MMKKILVIALVVVMAMSALPGLVAAQGPVELTFVGWGGPEEIGVFEKLVETFNANNADIVINYEPMPTDYVTALKTMVAGGTPPDIAYIPDGDFSAFASLGQLVSIQEFVDASENFDVDNVWPSALGRYMWDEETRSLGTGELYALPKDIGPTIMYINVDLFKEYGVELPDPKVPLTWDEVVEIGTALTVDVNGLHPDEEGFDPENVEVFGGPEVWFENAVFNNGGRIVSEDGRTFLMADDPNTVEAIQWISDLTHVYGIHPNSQQTASMSVGQMFETGRLAMTNNGRWATTFYRSVLDFEWDVIPHPVGPSGEVTSFNNQEDCSFSGWSGSVGVAIIAGSKGEEHAAEAYRFIEFIAGAEGQVEQAALGFQIPNQVDVALTDAFLQPDQYPANAEILLEAARCELPGPWTATPVYGQWFDEPFWGNVWPAVVVDGVDLAEDALADFASVFQEGLDDAWASIE